MSVIWGVLCWCTWLVSNRLVHVSGLLQNAGDVHAETGDQWFAERNTLCDMQIDARKEGECGGGRGTRERAG